jgi:Tfp pilus assembly protein PilO
MGKLKQWIALTVLGVLVIAAGGWSVLISPKRSEAAALRTQADQQTSQNATLSAQISMLKAQAKDLPKQQARLAAVAAKIPDNPALPALIRALTAAADQAGVELTTLAPAAPAPVTAAPPAGIVTAAGVSPSAAKPATASSPVSVGTLKSISLSLTVVGGYFQVEQFLDRVENLSRAAKVTGFTLAPGSNPVKAAPASAAGATGTAPVEDKGKTLAAAITANVYMASGRITTTPAAGK